MDSRRLFIALLLSMGVFALMQRFVPPVAPRAGTRADSVAAAKTAGNTATNSAANSTSVSAIPNGTASTAAGTTARVPGAVDSAHRVQATPDIRAETAIVMNRPDSGVRYAVTNVGAAPISVVMNAYENRAKLGGKVDLAAGGQPIVRYHLVVDKGAPFDLSNVPFSVTGAGNVRIYQAVIAGSTVAIHYTFAPDSYTVHVSGTVTPSGTGSNNYLLVDLPSTFTATEVDTAEDRSSLAYTYYSKQEGARNVLFRSLDPGEKTLAPGPLQWVAAKSKYFAVGILAPKNGPPFTEADLIGGARTSKVVTVGAATVVVPVNNGAFNFDLYTGPQSLKRLQAQGRDFEELNPYGWAFLHGVMQPIATGVTRLVLWMHERWALSYGMVLVVLGIFIRLIMWPLNQSSMRTSLKMQVLQPEVQKVQNRYKDDPEKQRIEIMKVYSEHGMSPFSPLLGCLPMMLPLPVLTALYFVFRSTIEFRGVPFLWIHDLSAADPHYILPVLVGVSMFLLSWIGMRNMPPNPQSKMMSYMMPVMFTAILFRLAAGLNVYYVVQNIAALPQQWLIARERQQQMQKKATGKARDRI